MLYFMKASKCKVCGHEHWGSEHVWAKATEASAPAQAKAVETKVEAKAEETPVELVGLSFRMPADFVREFKREALERGVKLNALLVAAFRALKAGS
jgi:hypothetical protein